MQREEEEKNMSVQVRAMERTFTYNGLQLPDPDPRFTAEQVRDLYASSYPEITTASIEGPDATGGTLRYKFTRALGTKG
jgi:PRTRC genetic system protein C